MPSPSQNSLRDLAKLWAAKGLSVVPVRPDGTKAPSYHWQELQHRIFSEEEIEREFKDDHGVAIIGGKISGNLEILDFDVPIDKETGEVLGPCVFDEWYEHLEIDLLEVVEQMPRVQTPSGGVHLYYRCEELQGNQKLARQFFDEYVNARRDPKPLTVIETRGEGGYCLAPGSPPACHPSGKTYDLIAGDFENIPVISVEQRSELFEVARAFDESRIEESKTEKTERVYPTQEAGGLRPGDDFDRRATWDEILVPLGWSFVFRRRDGAQLWCRPGKSKGISATIRPYTPPDSNVEKEYFYNFSANGDPFPEEEALTKFQAYTIAYHGGDYEAAARELGRTGYGEAPRAPSKIFDLNEIIDARRPDDVPWGDEEDPGVSTRVADLGELSEDESEEDAPRIPFGQDEPLGTSLFEEQVDPLEVQLFEDEEKLEREEQERRDRENERRRAISLARGPAYLVWRDFGDPPPRRLTDEGRIKTKVKRPRDTAWHILNDRFSYKDELRTLHHQHREFMMWDGKKYRRFDEDDIRPIVANYLTHFAQFKELDEDGEPLYEPFEVRKSRVAEMVTTLQDMIHIDSSMSDPSWLTDEADEMPDPREIVSCSNGLLDVASGDLLEPTPAYYSFTNTEIEYNINAKKPEAWIKFLETTLDEESRDLLQEWFGYCLVQDTRLHKLLMVVGKPGSGKGTAIRVLQKLIGQGSYCSMDFERLANNFALSIALGKSLMIFPDARQNYGSESRGGIVSTLLSISGEDDLMIDRKNLPPITQKLNTRIVIVSNDVLTLPDTSGALDRRQLWIRFPGFAGNSDPDLQNKLDSELSGILNWAIEGWHRVRKTGRFTEPESARDFRDSFLEQASPIKTFIDDMCVMDPAASQPTGEIFKYYGIWRKIRGYKNVQSQAYFGKSLISADMSIRKKRLRLKDGKRVPAYSGIRLDKDKIESFIFDNVGKDEWDKAKSEFLKNSEADIIDIFEYSQRKK